MKPETKFLCVPTLAWGCGNRLEGEKNITQNITYEIPPILPNLYLSMGCYLDVIKINFIEFNVLI